MEPDLVDPVTVEVTDEGLVARVAEHKVEVRSPKTAFVCAKLVDDEELLAKLGKDMLERIGYQVTSKQRSFEALEAFRNQPDKFDLVITDQTMPGMTGLEMARSMLEIRSDIPIILCTGYSNLVDEDVAKAQGIKGFALKPVEIKDIATLIRQILDGDESIV